MNILSIIDHTILKATATPKDIEKLCEEAKKYGFASVCVNPLYVKLASTLLKGSKVKVCTVISFPLGNDSAIQKALSAKNSCLEGADEIDIVQNIGAAVNNDFETVEHDISEVRQAMDEAEKLLNKKLILKVILETCYLTDEQIIKCCEASKKAKADFVKTSTGFGTGGATIHHVELMRKTVGNEMGVKASGGIRCLKDAQDMVKAGASRIGASSGVKIASELEL